MKSIKSEITTVNVSVIGLSGTETIKGIYGVGKSCLCNRLSQPNNYKYRHPSVISAVDFFEPTYNQGHWLYWSNICKEIRGRKFVFHFVEQTAFIDDNSYQELRCSAQLKDYVKRAVALDLQGSKKAYICGSKSSDNSEFLKDNFHVNIFLLVYDVSFVERRNYDQQDLIFRRLLDSVISLKVPILIVLTKYDCLSDVVLERFRQIRDRKLYSKIPVIQTSSKLNVNIEQIYELIVNLYDSGNKNIKIHILNYQEALKQQQDVYEKWGLDLRTQIRSFLVVSGLFSSFDDFRSTENSADLLTKLGMENSIKLFDEVYSELIQQKKSDNYNKCKNIFRSLLKKSGNLIPAQNPPCKTVASGLLSDESFMSHFELFEEGLEYYTFQENLMTLPFYILDANNEDNLLFMVDEFAREKDLEDRLFQYLVKDCFRNFRKSLEEITEELSNEFNYILKQKKVAKVVNKFYKHYVNILKQQFLERILENPDLFWSHTQFRCLEISPLKSVCQNGRSSLYLDKIIKEINPRIEFPILTVEEDKNNLREEWIQIYLQSILDSDDCDCVIRDITDCPCSVEKIKDGIIKFGFSADVDKVCPHIIYVIALALPDTSHHLVNAIQPHLSTVQCKNCKVHGVKFEIKMFSSLSEMLELEENICSFIVLFICCTSLMHLSLETMEEISKMEKNMLNRKLSKYILHFTEERPDVKFGDIDDVYILKNNYQIISLSPDDIEAALPTIFSNSENLFEPVVIWIVSVCGDRYDTDSVIKFFLDVLKNISTVSITNNKYLSLTGVYKNGDSERQFQISFISYHQAFRLIIQSSNPVAVDGIILLNALDRMASSTSCFAIRQYMPLELSLTCRSFMLCLDNDNSRINFYEKVVQKAFMFNMTCEYFRFDCDDNFNAKKSLTDYLSVVFDFVSVPYSSNVGLSKSLVLSNDASDTVYDILDSGTVCRVCCQQCKNVGRSGSNITTVGLDYEAIYGIPSFSVVLGNTNERNYELPTKEYMFSEAIIYPRDSLEDCFIYFQTETNLSPIKSFRTRIRSHSGPDLRSVQNSAINICFYCGQEISYPCDHSSSPFVSRQSLRYNRQIGVKEPLSKKFTTRLQEWFNPSRKQSDSQVGEIKKPFVRIPSKKHK